MNVIPGLEVTTLNQMVKWPRVSGFMIVATNLTIT